MAQEKRVEAGAYQDMTRELGELTRGQRLVHRLEDSVNVGEDGFVSLPKPTVAQRPGAAPCSLLPWRRPEPDASHRPLPGVCVHLLKSAHHA